MSADSKAEARAAIRRARAKRGPEPRIAQHCLPLATAAEVVIGYACLPGEPDIDAALDAARAHGIPVFSPVVHPGAPLRFGRVTMPMQELPRMGRWQIREPADEFSAAEVLGFTPDVNGQQTQQDTKPTEVLLLVPMLGCSATGARLGNGGGFYDRTFGPAGQCPIDAPAAEDAPGLDASLAGDNVDQAARQPTVRVIGVCFDAERDLADITAESWDLRPHAVLTETGLHPVS